MVTTITAVIAALGTGVASAFSGWVFGRKKQRIDDINYAQDTWQKVIENLEKRVGILLEKVEKLSVENDRLMTEVIELRKENAKLRVEVEELNEKLSNVKTITKKA